MIELREVTKRYLVAGREIRAVDRVSLTVGRGELVAVVGPSGSGKSTLLSLMGCVTRPTAGQVLVDGADPWRLSDGALSVLRGRKVGFIFQFAGLIPSLTALENVQLPALFSRDLKNEARAKELLEAVGLGDRMMSRPCQLSGGEQRRVAVARALFAGPEALLADEPTADLDEESEAEVLRAVRCANERGTAVVLVTHSRHLVQPGMRLVQLRRGRIVEDDGPQPGVAVAVGTWPGVNGGHGGSEERSALGTGD